MDKTRQQTVYELLKRGLTLVEKGDQLPAEWARVLFPPERREYELVYYGKETEEEILSTTMALPLQPTSTFGKGDSTWENKLIFGDNLQAMRTLLNLKEKGELLSADGTSGIKLVYIDPPFGTGDEYDVKGAPAYSAKLQGGKYLEFIRKRATLIQALMAETSMLYVRIDYHFIHPLKLLLDEVFGPENFLNEIIINRRKKSAQETKRYNVATDSILVYAKGNLQGLDKPLRGRLCSFCNQPVLPAWHDMISSGIRRPPERTFGKQVKLPPKNMHFTYTQERINKMYQEGRVRIDDSVAYTDLGGKRENGMPEYLQSEKTPVDSNWMDLKSYTSKWSYPTENSEELLDRVIRSSSKPGDLVMDCFAGSGTTVAVAEKLGRRWIAIDSGKLAIYTIQKRLLTISTSKKPEDPKKKYGKSPEKFTFFNAGLYDFESLRKLRWEDWRFFALQLFECVDDPHEIHGFHMDGKRQGSAVYVFNHFNEGTVSRETVADIHTSIGKVVGDRCFIIAPRGAFLFQEDYVELDGVRYYALRIPYSYINELHRQEFSALIQPNDELSVNETVDAIGFDFIQPPVVELETSLGKEGVRVRIKRFESRARVHGKEITNKYEALSMVMIDFNFSDHIFDLDRVLYGSDLKGENWTFKIPVEDLGEKVMLVFLDIYGNESRILVEKKMLVKNRNK